MHGCGLWGKLTRRRIKAEKKDIGKDASPVELKENPPVLVQDELQPENKCKDNSSGDHQQELEEVNKSKENCSICAEDHEPEKMTSLEACDHRFCIVCLKSYLETRVKDGHTKSNCLDPSCSKSISSRDCKKLLSKGTLELLHRMKKESVIPWRYRVYCPRKKCSAIMDSRVSPQFVACCSCGEKFCTKCKRAWHEQLDCSALVKLDRELQDENGVKFHLLAMSKKWVKCPRCRMFVEHNKGCYHMKCRCGTAFCYGCGKRRYVCACERD